MPELPRLFRPTTIGSLRLKNRLVMPPMVTNYATEDGEATPRLIDYLVARARGGVGAIVVEASYVRADGRGFLNELGIHRDDLVPGLRQLVQAVHDEGARVAIQIFHAGRQTGSAVTGVQPIAPSPIADRSTNEIPRELTLEEIEQLEIDFMSAARRAVRAGFDAVEIHGAHGYLIGEFLSPFSNRRTDAYGAGIAGRAHFACEIVQRVREAVGADYPILFRLGAEERVEGGLTIEQSRVIASLLEEAGIDALDVSAGNYATPGGLITAPMDLPRALLAPLAAQIKRVVDVPVIVADRIHDPLVAEQVIADGSADLVAVGRALLTDPEWPNKAQRGALDDIFPCISCNQACIGRLMRQKSISCMLNPACGREQEMAIVRAEEPKRVLVIGGGPAGLESARVLAERGHIVHLLEKHTHLGGEFLAAAIAPNKEEIANAIRWMVQQIYRLGVDVETGITATPDLVERLHPDSVVVATGARAIRPPIPGMDREEVVLASDVLLGRRPTGERVLVMGGGPVGLEVAQFLAAQGKRVTIVEPTPVVGYGAQPSRLYWILESLRQAGVPRLTETSLEEIEPGIMVRVRREGEEETLGSFDNVVLAAGYEADQELYHQIHLLAPEAHLIGDAQQVRGAVEAMLSAARVARAI